MKIKKKKKIVMVNNSATKPKPKPCLRDPQAKVTTVLVPVFFCFENVKGRGRQMCVWEGGREGEVPKDD